MINYDTFEDSKEFATVPFIVDRINEMSKKDQANILRFFHKFNIMCHQLRCLFIFKAIFNADYLCSLVLKDYQEKIDTILAKRYDPLLVSYIHNYVYTKINRKIRNVTIY